ncbi:MAG: DUF4405 domain-containing protein [Hyphomicrobiales bacterium]|nr:DUF4405 domain-containing protein [Hyphomicrobiales bacterium]MCP5371036.1 DUF4405 domain-containing protein [Hyphomicrobiales bacterium]
MADRTHRFNWRSLTAFIVTWAFLVATVTGVVLYIVPHGRVAYWINWTLAGLGRTGWADVHILFGAVFIVTGVLHLYFNWKPFKNYLAERAGGHLHLRRELWVSLAGTVALVVLAVGHLPPASWLFDLNERVKGAWVANPAYEPPYGHAEETSLAGFARRQGMDLDRVTAELRAAGIAFAGPRARLKDIAAANGMTAMGLYAVIRKLEPPPAPLPGGDGGVAAAAVEARLAGSGMGRKTVADFCAETGLTPELAAERLRAAGIRWDGADKLRSIAERHGMTPMDLAKVMLAAR